MPPAKKTSARKAPAKRAAATPALTTVAEVPTEIEDRTGRFFEIQDEVSAPKSYRMTPDIVLEPMTRRKLRAYFAAETDEERGRILFGEHAEAIEELYEDRPMAEWHAMLRDIRAFHFGQGADDLPGGSQGS